LQSLAWRSQRRVEERLDGGDNRTAFARDRDRILYSAAFRRLAVITQVVSPDEGCSVHNRLTHVLKVAQVGRSLANRLLGTSNEKLVTDLGGLDADVVEAACLAHDLGHPPFGHIAETELDSLAVDRPPKLKDGFEGNAQSFRVATCLELKSRDYEGLNLTRATLNALLKYPWYRETDGDEEKKWGAYHSEKHSFEFARQGLPAKHRTLEAELMDWADDIAYSVHDMEDFYVMRRIPLDRLVRDKEERATFIEAGLRRMKVVESQQSAFREQAERFLLNLPVTEAFSGSAKELVGIRSYGSFLINRFIRATSLQRSGLEIPSEERTLVAWLKQLTWHYVIDDDSLAVQQEGQRHMIRKLFEIFADAEEKLYPPLFREAASNTSKGTKERSRVVLDFISGLTEQQAISIYQRLTGASLGSIFDGRR
jgi:dGTPase